MDQQVLKNILEKHRKWVMGEGGGERADLSSADLSFADLRSADLRFADLSFANLRFADLSFANLRFADLRFADLRSADLRSADLRFADLRFADLRFADLSLIKEDFFNRLALAKKEVPGLYEALNKGRVDGSCYEGECACFVGTIAKVCGVKYDQMPELKPDSESATEKWFLGIWKGQIPMSNQVAQITSEWIEEWCREQGIVLPRYEIMAVQI